MTTEKLIIDKVADVSIDWTTYQNEINTLLQLKTGLLFLFNNVRPTELKVATAFDNKQVSLFGDSEHIPKDFQQHLPSFFHWFATSVCNYARLTGYLVGRETGQISATDKKDNPAKIKTFCDDYMKGLTEMQDVIKWRNKVAGHFALTDPVSHHKADPTKNDNFMTLNASAINLIGFSNDRFITSSLQMTTFDPVTKAPISSDLPSWSLTQLFETLTNRFWPDVKFSA